MVACWPKLYCICGDIAFLTPLCRNWSVRTPLQYFCLENPMDGEAWWAAVHEVAKSRIWLSDLTFTFHFHALDKEMATHSSVLAWRVPGTGEPCGLPSMGSHRVGHDWSDLAAAVAVLNSFVSLLKLFVNYLEGQYSQWVKWSKINLFHGPITYVLYKFF